MRAPTQTSLLAFASLGIALACGCGPYGAGVVEETSGLLGNGVFRWRCSDASDPTCGTGVFPTTVALGSRFELQFFEADDLPDDLAYFTLEPSSPAWLLKNANGFIPQQPGDFSVVVLGDGFAIDYITLATRAVDDLTVTEDVPPETDTCNDVDYDGICDEPADSPVTLVVGDVTTLKARAFGGGTDLAGALPYTWTSLTPALVELSHPDGRSTRATVHGSGLARLSVQAGDFTKEFEFTVEAPPLEPETTGPSSGSGSSDSGSGSGSDSGSGSGSSSDSGSDSGSSSGSSSDSSTSGGETDGSTTTGGL